MLTSETKIEESKLPKYTDPKMAEWAKKLGEEWDAWDQARASLAKDIWTRSDRAFMAIRDDLPMIPSMRYVDNGMLGDPGVRNAIKQFRDDLMSAVCPPDESWLEPVSMNDEDDDGTQQKVKNMLIAKHQDAGARDAYSIAFDQLGSRGVTAVGVRWEVIKIVKTSPKEMMADLQEIAEEVGLVDDDGNPIAGQDPDDGRYWETAFNGPVIYPINMHHLWLDPTANLPGLHADMPFIHLTFKSMADLKGAVDPETGENLYDKETLDTLTQWTYKEFFDTCPHAVETTKLMGIDPGCPAFGKFVPVYMFYKKVRQFTDDHDEVEATFVDKYFYVARSQGGRGRDAEWKIIRVQNNPSRNGVKPFYVVNNDPYLDTPYGVSIAEKALSALKAKDIIDAISLNVAVMQANPASYYVGNVLKDDKKPRYMPGSSQEIVNRPGVGLEWIKPYPMNPATPEMNLQQSKHYGEMVATGTGVRSAQTAADPTRAPSSRQTATEIRQTSAEASMSASTVTTRVADRLVEPVANAMHELCRENYLLEQRYIVNPQNASPYSEKLTPDEINRDRYIKIVGRRAVANKGSIVQNCLEMLKVLSNPQASQVVGNLPMIIQDIIFKMMSDLSMPVKDQYRMQPEQLMAMDPKLQNVAVQQALQDPQKLQQIAEAIAQSPQGRAALEQMKHDAIQEHMAGEAAGQKPTGGASNGSNN